MFRKLAAATTDNLTTLFAILYLDRIASVFWNWHYELTEPEREQATNEFFRRTFRRERSQ